MSKKLIGYSNDVDEIMDMLDKEGAFDEEAGAEEEIEESEEE